LRRAPWYKDTPLFIKISPLRWGPQRGKIPGGKKPRAVKNPPTILEKFHGFFPPESFSKKGNFFGGPF